MGLFGKKQEKKSYDQANQKPVIKSSICTGEQVAGFQNIHTGSFEDVRLIRGREDLEDFKNQYGITGDIDKIY